MAASSGAVATGAARQQGSSTDELDASLRRRRLKVDDLGQVFESVPAGRCAEYGHGCDVDRRIDPFLQNRPVTYDEMCIGLAELSLTTEQLQSHWQNLPRGELRPVKVQECSDAKQHTQ